MKKITLLFMKLTCFLMVLLFSLSSFALIIKCPTVKKGKYNNEVCGTVPVYNYQWICEGTIDTPWKSATWIGPRPLNLLCEIGTNNSAMVTIPTQKCVNGKRISRCEGENGINSFYCHETSNNCSSTKSKL